MTATREAPILIDLSAREQRIYDRLRSQIVSPSPDSHSGFRDLMLLLPDLTVLLFRLLRDERVPPGSKALAALALGYIVSPFDLIPELILGPIAFVDDLFIVGTALSRMVNHVHPDVVRSHWSGRGDALDAIQRVTSWTEITLTKSVRRLVRGVLGH